MNLKKLIRDRARAAAMRTVTRELEVYRDSLKDAPDMTLDLLNSGLQVNLTVAKRKGVDILLDTLNGSLNIITKKERNNPKNNP
jgi:hypothetical protein